MQQTIAHTWIIINKPHPLTFCTGPTLKVSHNKHLNDDSMIPINICVSWFAASSIWSRYAGYKSFVFTFYSYHFDTLHSHKIWKQIMNVVISLAVLFLVLAGVLKFHDHEIHQFVTTVISTHYCYNTILQQQDTHQLHLLLHSLYIFKTKYTL